MLSYACLMLCVEQLCPLFRQSLFVILHTLTATPRCLLTSIEILYINSKTKNTKLYTDKDAYRLILINFVVCSATVHLCSITCRTYVLFHLYSKWSPDVVKSR